MCFQVERTHAGRERKSMCPLTMIELLAMGVCVCVCVCVLVCVCTCLQAQELCQFSWLKWIMEFKFRLDVAKNLKTETKGYVHFWGSISICYPKVDSFQHKANDMLVWNVSSLEPREVQWSCPELRKPERNTGTLLLLLCALRSHSTSFDHRRRTLSSLRLFCLCWNKFPWNLPVESR